ncbi:flagellar hook-length control protein FliK [Brevibacillus fluminis]|uniref:flagellar hook-length control protein FliK n=1 Tax=Brevibacillus fluminis TaxID=511487 RepID=UPI003F8C5D0B
MNVNNAVTTFTAADAQAATGLGGGKNAAMPEQQAGFGSLLATELTGLLANIQTQTVDSLVPQTAEQDDQGDDVGDLLAMLDQLLQSGTVNMIPQQAIEQASQAAQTESPDQGQVAVSLQPNVKQALVTAFVNQGVDDQRATQMADLLESLVRSQSSDQQPQVKQAVQQAVAILAKYGVDVQQVVQPGGAAKDPELSFTTAKKTVGGNPRDIRYSPVTQFQSAMQAHLLPHQVQVALAKYQPGLAIRPEQPQTQLDQLLQAALQNVADVTNVSSDEAQTNNNAFAGSLQTALQPNAQQSNAPIAQPSGELVRSEQLPKDVANLFVKQMKIVGANGMSEAKITLHPQALGQVDVKITANNHVITAQFAADTHAGKELLDNQLPQLRAALTQLGLQVDRLEVTQQQPSQQAQFGFQEQRGSQQNRQGEQNKQSNEDDAEFNIDALTESGGADSWLASKQAKVEYSV